MKKILIALVAAFAAAGLSHAQQYSATSLYSSGTNSIAANSTNAVGQTFVVTKNKVVGLQLTFTGTTGNSANVTANLARSVDGSSYESTPSVTLTAAANGTNAVTAVTNVDTGGGGWLKLVSLVNGNNTLTNVAVKASKKPGQ